MYDYNLHLQAKHKLDDMRRENQRRSWLRDALNHALADRAERSRKAQNARDNG
ncbi:MAG: hypothetical protein IPK52_17165 [Chloroflexi bacterium]|nr:hypothetical protein [Chloroflexota bacterium]